MIVRAAIALLVLAACGEPPSPPPTAPTATASLEVPPLPQPKPSAEKPVVRQSVDNDESMLPRDPAAAESEFENGKRAMAVGDDAKARASFMRSYRLDPAIGTLLNLALVEERLGMKDKAIEHYQAVVDASQKNGRNDRAAMAKARLDALKNPP